VRQNLIETKSKEYMETIIIVCLESALAYAGMTLIKFSGIISAKFARASEAPAVHRARYCPLRTYQALDIFVRNLRSFSIN
jgi:hypothetical protein